MAMSMSQLLPPLPPATTAVNDPAVADAASPIADSFPTSSENINFTDNEKEEIYKKLMDGKYKTLVEMATDINQGVKSEEIKKYIFKNTISIMMEEL